MNDKIVFLGEEIDFEKTKPVSIFVRDYEAKEFDFNVFGAVFLEGRRDYHARFRFRFPSGNKTVIATGIRTTLLSLQIEIDSQLEYVISQFKKLDNVDLKVVHRFEVDIPKNARDYEGFMAVITASDQFNIYHGTKEECREQLERG